MLNYFSCPKCTCCFETQSRRCRQCWSSTRRRRWISYDCHLFAAGMQLRQCFLQPRRLKNHFHDPVYSKTMTQTVITRTHMASESNGRSKAGSGSYVVSSQTALGPFISSILQKSISSSCSLQCHPTCILTDAVPTVDHVHHMSFSTRSRSHYPYTDQFCHFSTHLHHPFLSVHSLHLAHLRRVYPIRHI